MTVPFASLSARFALRRRQWLPVIEVGAVAALVIMAVVTWVSLTSDVQHRRLLDPLLPGLLLLGNLVPAITLLVLIGRRIAKGRAARSIVGGDGQLHVRLVAIFSLIASVPTILVVIFASILFQVGVQFWFSDRAKATVEGAATVAQSSYAREQDRIARNTTALASDTGNKLKQVNFDDPRFIGFIGFQLLQRELSEGMIFTYRPNGFLQSAVHINPYDRDMEKFITPAMIQRLRAGAAVVDVPNPDGIGAVARLPYGADNYVYVARIDPEFGAQIRRARLVLADYRELGIRSRLLQLRFNAALLVISLLIVGGAVWIALEVADRLVRPVGALVDAARKVTGGDLSARVAATRSHDEVGTLAKAFNRMTERLQQQTGELVAANDQIERRRALIEAVLSGVSAGVIALTTSGEVRLANASAAALLASDDTILAGKQLSDISPALAEMLDSGQREAVVTIDRADDTRTLAVRASHDDAGHVLTFDDITQQLIDQRRAAWSDVARRIAHEIKNPLTPIQLAAERLQRRYGSEVTNDPATFQKLTDTIVRQVGDLRRMVDEFSSFARMPKPQFRSESIVDICRQSLFLHEVAHPKIAFRLIAADGAPEMVCDRRQIGQALTNLIKNGVEAIEAAGAEGGTVSVEITADARATTVTVNDTGVGLPADRGRIVEPYVTTRARGTGLGLAIVQKIVEEHYATMRFLDRSGGGATVSMTFDTERLAQMQGAIQDPQDRLIAHGA